MVSSKRLNFSRNQVWFTERLPDPSGKLVPVDQSCPTSCGVAVGLQLLMLYTPLLNLFGVVMLDWRAWIVMISFVVVSSLTGVYMRRWILMLVPMWI